MNRLWTFTALAGLCAAFAGAPAQADDDPVLRRLELMQQELDRMRQDNEGMRSEIDRLRAANDDNWMTEQRAAEIRAIVHDVLADADTRASLLGTGLMGGWSNGFFLASHDNRFRLQFEGLMQFRFLYNYNNESPPSPFGTPNEDKHRSGFEATRTWLTFRGHVFSPDLTYLVRGNFQRDRGVTPQGGGFYLLDAFVRYHLTDEISIRFGQFKLPFTREFLVSPGHQLLVERSLVDTNMNIGRSQGIEFTWMDSIQRASVAYHVGGMDNLIGQSPGVAGGNPMSTVALAADVEYAWTARYEHLLAGNWRQFEDFTSPMDEEFALMLGAAMHIQRTEATGQPTFPSNPPRANRWYGYTLDASAEWGGANAFVAFTHFYIDQPTRNINVYGVVGQGGFYVTPKIELFARYEFGKFSTNATDVPDEFKMPLHLLTAGFTYYIDGHDVKWTTDIGIGLKRVERGWTRLPNPGQASITGWRQEGRRGPHQILFRTQFQLLF